MDNKRFKDWYSAASQSIYNHANREKLIFVNWGYSSYERLSFLPETLGFANRFVENDLFGFGRDQERPIVGYVVDRQRPYFDGRGPTDLEQNLNDYVSGSWKSDPDAVAFLDAMRAAKMHKFSQFSDTADELVVAQEDLVIFGQVEGDAAWVMNATSVSTNVELVAKAIDTVSGCRNIYYKPHPKHRTWPKDQLEITSRFPQVRQVDPKVSFKSMLVNRPSVFVNTSGTGLDAGLAGCRVYVAGLAFYAGWAATTDVGPVTSRRTNKLTFEDIVVVICSQYSRYFFREDHRRATLADLTADIKRGEAKRQQGSGEQAISPSTPSAG